MCVKSSSLVLLFFDVYGRPFAGRRAVARRPAVRSRGACGRESALGREDPHDPRASPVLEHEDGSPAASEAQYAARVEHLLAAARTRRLAIAVTRHAPGAPRAGDARDQLRGARYHLTVGDQDREVA